MRLIDADKLKTEISECYEYEFPTASGSFDKFATQIVPSIINNAPTVDAVEVVRCGGCRYYRGSLDGYTCENEFWNAEYLVPTEPDDYCSYGERKEVTHEET